MNEALVRTPREILFLASELDVVTKAAKRVRIAAPEVIFSEGQRYYNEENLLDEVSPGAILVRTIATQDGYGRFWLKYQELVERKAKKDLTSRVPKPQRLISRRLSFST